MAAMTGRPKVSLLLPVRNAGPFLAERLRSIKAQTLEEWELIVLDGYSDDGSWEKLLELGREDVRVRCVRRKPKGIYRAFNDAVRLATGEYIYFATADDTMESQCLQVMVEGLECNPTCDLAHCLLQIIDEEGRPSEKRWDDFFYNRYYGKLLHEWHIRKAPHDGWLHFLGVTAYTSLTQMLFRRRLFDELGLFREDYGSVADYEWYMRVALRRDTLHVPLRLAAWRVHEKQATSEGIIQERVAKGHFLKMARKAVGRDGAQVLPPHMSLREVWSLLKQDRACERSRQGLSWLHRIPLNGNRWRRRGAPLSIARKEAFLMQMMVNNGGQLLLVPAREPLGLVRIPAYDGEVGSREG